MYDTLSKRLLFLAAAAIVVVTLGYTQHLSSIIREEEQRKVDLWVEAVKQRAELVTYTQTLFEDLGAEEKKRADRLASVAPHARSQPSSQSCSPRSKPPLLSIASDSARPAGAASADRRSTRSSAPP